MTAALLLFGFAARQATVQAAPPVQALQGNPERGAYIFSAAAGCGCHITEKGFLAGGAEVAGPFGKVYSRNITPDPETGIGSWTEEQIVTAVRTGKTPKGEQLFPVMPYMTYSGMADQDAYDLAAFIKTVPPVKNQVPKDQLNAPLPPFSPPAAPAPAPLPATGGDLTNLPLLAGLVMLGFVLLASSAVIWRGGLRRTR